MSDTQALELMRRVRPARAACASGSGTVLDELLKHSGATLVGIDTMLRQAAGIAAVDSGPGVVIDPHALSPAQLKAFGCVALRCRDETEVRLGFADPWDDQRVQQAAAALGRWPLLAAVSSALLGQPNAGSLDAGSLRDGAQPADPVAVAVIDFVDGALSRACDIGASDVHFECDRTGVTVKHRLDGVMVRYARLDGLAKSEQVVSRIKVLAQLDITERRTPQDGRFRWQQAQRSVDLRVSIMPSIHGEDAVLRLLDRAQLRASTDTASLDGLGFNPDDAERLRALASCPTACCWSLAPRAAAKRPPCMPRCARSTAGEKKSSPSKTRWNTSSVAYCRSRSTSARG